MIKSDTTTWTQTTIHAIDDDNVTQKLSPMCYDTTVKDVLSIYSRDVEGAPKGICQIWSKYNPVGGGNTSLFDVELKLCNASSAITIPFDMFVLVQATRRGDDKSANTYLNGTQICCSAENSGLYKLNDGTIVNVGNNAYSEGIAIVKARANSKITFDGPATVRIRFLCDSTYQLWYNNKLFSNGRPYIPVNCVRDNYDSTNVNIILNHSTTSPTEGPYIKVIKPDRIVNRTH